jgi:hypothetical protein
VLRLEVENFGKENLLLLHSSNPGGLESGEGKWSSLERPRGLC